MKFENYLAQLIENKLESKNKEEICISGCSKILKEVYNDIKNIKKKETLKFLHENLNIPYSTIYCWISGSNPVPIPKAISLIKLWKDTCGKDELDLSFLLDQLYTNVLSYSQNGQRKVMLPKEFDVDLAYLIGFFQGDGHLKKKSNGIFQEYSLYFYEADKRMLNRLNDIIYSKFSIKGNIYFQKNETGSWYTLRVSSKPIYLFLRDVLFLKSGRKTRNVEVPIVIKNNNDLYLSFIRGFFDAEGAVGKTIKGPWLSIGQASDVDPPEILLWIRNILRENNIIMGKIERSDNDFFRIRTSKREFINRFFDIVSSYHPNKIGKFEEILKC